MIIKAIVFFLILLAVVFQISVLPIFSLGGIIPDLALVLVVLWVVQEGFDGAFSKVLTLSILVDLFNFHTVGMMTISFVLIAFGVSSFSKRFLVAHKTWRFSMLAVTVFAATLINNFFVVFLMRADNYLRNSGIQYFPTLISKSIFEEAALNVVLMILIYFPLKKVERFLEIYRFKKVSLK